MADDSMTGRFVDEGSETWYRIDGHDSAPPFFVTLASDSDLWTFVSTAGSLAAGRRDQDGAFFPYETVDKIHLRWEHTGPRTWILVPWADGFREPFAPRLDGRGGARSVWKNLSGTRRRFREEHPSGRLVFQYEWSTAAGLGLVRTARLEAPAGPVRVSVLDGLLNLVPPGVSFEQSSTMSSLADAYKWNESAAGGRLALYTLYARIWDRPEPKESFEALAAWHAGLPADTRTLLSAHQLRDFCRTGRVEAETLTRGRRGAFLENFDAEVGAAGLDWHLVVDAPRSQAEAYELARHLQSGGGSPAEITAALARNTAGLDELLARADAFQVSGDRMAAAHHRVNVLFNCMRGGVFVDGTCFDRDDLLAFVTRRSRRLGPTLRQAAADLGEAATPLAEAYERLLGHHAFTGRPGTMFGYEGLGCIYWHMVAKLLLAVQERVFEAADRRAPQLPVLQAYYRRVRDGLGYRRGAAAYGAFPADPYSHTPGEGGAQQPGMTGQVKEEILTRWGELGLRVRDGRVHFDPVLLDEAEIPGDGALTFTWARVPYAYRRGPQTRLRILTEQGWRDCPDRSFDPRGVQAVEAEVRF